MNLSPGWNFNPANRVEILLQLHDEFQPGAKYEIAREESQENQNGAEDTNRENMRIASLAVLPFGGAQFLTFWDGSSVQYKMMEIN